MKQNILFASDLDNTLLFSYKHKQNCDICVEYLQGKQQGFFTPKSIKLLQKINSLVEFIPVTSRSVEQYQRIQFPKDTLPHYAVTTNGAILLIDGEVDPDWYQISRQAVDPWQRELQNIYEMLNKMPLAKHFRIVDDMYLFTTCENPQDAAHVAYEIAPKTQLDVTIAGRKVYFCPPAINKGQALKRLKDLFSAKYTISAGDTTMDIPMLEKADCAIIPDRSLSTKLFPSFTYIHKGNQRFPEYVLQQVELFLQNCR